MYDFTYRINYEDDDVDETLVVTIMRVSDGETLFISKLPVLNVIPVVDSITYELIFYIMCVSPNMDNMQVMTIPSDVDL